MPSMPRSKLTSSGESGNCSMDEVGKKGVFMARA
jgi:hypothetical protein